VLFRGRVAQLPALGFEEQTAALGLMLSLGARRSLAAQVIQFLTVECHTAICEREACRQGHQTILGHGYAAVAYGGLILYFEPVLAPEVNQLENTTPVPDWLN
jgi:hypothetical protein